MNPYLKFVEGIQDGVESAKGLMVEGKTAPVESDQKVLLFSPHPDDECITGLLPLRLMREAGKRIINIPVTFGSNVARQAGRAEELKNACAYLGWESFTGAGNFHSLDVADVVRLLKAFHPEIIFMPHAHDWNSRHIETHFLVVAALEKMGADFSCIVVETEFWGAMADPNLMVEGDAKTVADLVAATSLHVGEVARNPYHLLLPAWMQDNVRRGGELVGGQGGAVPDFSFATLYRARKWQGGEWVELFKNGKTLAMGAKNLMEIF